MLSLVGWLIVVWLVWTIVFFVTTWLIRFTMSGQQEFVIEQEEAITAAQTAAAHGDGAVPTTAPGLGSVTQPARKERPELKRTAPLRPPLSAT
ncbi:MAG TPA: hypothetical protein VFN78_15110 [Ktedonobacterales bacterium]|nr:hypothetical protein [Ktedonobacterales bacterium]